ncbi:hypothetical protein KAFR_0E00390 [Kazachstania africana CBS 2517]|uniref:Cleavage/polyadenylation specificity factor A subunit C-terminal domain-containing protein n=1 Tax=Kazachstania africana (strain ATCC 22294 / BCRC 22015 / CBS 2517 / CECT 1963 / NBRC 1671 / NRRL Y-8276) TaxID=1071382 RepID=H2AUZ3_KAZAF|nr:hypothetical protein KAFR_0E00390 [Kazachstania africana CBS 2517]CCF58193.1 hypothetical protein KAFR_0E00390 [Kazachstania africana CBS 2517]
MLVQESDIHLYHLTLQRQSNYTLSCTGHFVDLVETQVKQPRPLQLLLATETHVELYDISTGSFSKIYQWPIFATLKTMQSFRPINSKFNFIAITSDAGNLTILHITKSHHSYKLTTLYNEPITRSGIRRLAAIEYCQIDPRSRCLMISAIEKFKFAYLLNYNEVDSKLTISSPLEIIRSNYITLSLVACASNFIDNPIFASLEIDSHKNSHLIFYMLDLSLNHIVKKSDYTLHPSANFLMDLPDLAKYGISTNILGNDEQSINSFVIVGFNSYILIKDLNGYYNIKISIPKRENSTHNDSNDHPVTIISGCLQTVKDGFFILLQTNVGDLFKLKVDPDENDRNRPTVSFTYFDTIPRSEQLHIFKNGYLFANCELHDNYLLQFESLGSDIQEINESFSPNLQSLENLAISDTQKNLNPLLPNTINLNQSTPLVLTQKYANDDSIRHFSNSIDFEDFTSSDLPLNPQNLWTLKLNSSAFHELLVLSFQNSTMLLKVENDSIEDMKFPDSVPFILKNDKTIHVTILNNIYIIQVCHNQLVQVSTSDFKQVSSWFPPAGIHIIAASSTHKQLVVALSNNQVIYFEMPGEDSTLVESTKKLQLSTRVLTLSLRLDVNKFSKNLIVATDDALIHIVSLDHEKSEDEFLEITSFQKLLGNVSSITYIEDTIHLGLDNGVYIRSKFFGGNNDLISDVRTKYLGNKPVNLSILPRAYLRQNAEEETEEDNEESGINDPEKESTSCVVIHSENTWVHYNYDNLEYIRPVSFSGDYKNLKRISEFTTTDIKYNGCCALSNSGKLIIGRFKTFIFKNNWFRIDESKILRSDEVQEDDENGSTGDDEEEEELNQKFTMSNFINKTTLSFNGYTIFLENFKDTSEKQCRVSIMRAQFKEFLNNEGQSNSVYQTLPNVNVSSATTLNFSDKTVHLILSTDKGTLLTFELSLKKENYKLLKMHETLIGEKVSTIIPFNNMLLVPLFGSLVLYSLGKKQLLKKSITKLIPSIRRVSTLANWENLRIAVGDNYESVTVYEFDKQSNEFIPLADDTIKRSVTALAFLDELTVIGGDKYGNIWTLRLPEDTDPVNTEINSFRDLPKNIMECPFKLKLKNHFYVNDIPMSFHVIESLQRSDRVTVLYSGLQGTIGIFIPILSKNQIKTLKSLETSIDNLEMAMLDFRSDKKSRDDEDDYASVTEERALVSRDKANEVIEGSYSTVGRDRFIYRSYYAPVKHVIDGDLCETFIDYSQIEQDLICQDIGKKFKPLDIIRMINEVRTNYI